jgi:type IV pilus assembly protein PilM
VRLFANRKIGVDIGASAVRIVEVVGLDSYGYAIIRRAASIPLREGVVVAGEIKHPAVVGQALDAAFKKAKLPRHGFVLGTTSRFVTIGEMESPDAVLPAERTAQIRMSRQELSPTVPLGESAISWNIVNTDVTATRNIVHTLNVAAALNREIAELQNVCKLANAVPQAIDLTGAALIRAMVRISPDDEAIATVVDVGATKTLVATRKGLHLRSVRTIPLGGASITRALMGVTDVPFEEAEERKRFIRIRGARTTGSESVVAVTDESPMSTAEMAVNRAAEQLVEEIAKSASSDAMAHNRQMTQGIQLTGGGSRLMGLAERIQTRVGVPTAKSAQWADAEFNKSTAYLFSGGETDPEALNDLTAAVGLALWRSPS